MLEKIPAFIDGASLLHHNRDTGKLFVANSEGILKVFEPNEPDVEPVSADIPENCTCVASFGSQILVSNGDGHLAALEASTLGRDEPKMVLRAKLPIRSVVFINEGKRALCGGDDGVLHVIDLASGLDHTISAGESIVDVSYNSKGDLAAVFLDSGKIKIFTVFNEIPQIIETISVTGPGKSFWALNDEVLIAADSRAYTLFDRTTWKPQKTVPRSNAPHFAISPDGRHFASLQNTGELKLFSVESGEEAQLTKILTLGELVPLSIAWTLQHVFASTGNGELHKHPIALPNKEVELLFLDNASESEDEVVRPRHGLDDSVIIDQDDSDDMGGYAEELERVKRRKTTPPPPEIIVPYSPGSTPWITSAGSSRRRYMFMNAAGYVWAVQSSLEGNTSYTVSFFDRTENKDYHFVDDAEYDLCSMNERGVVFAHSAGEGKRDAEISYRHHASTVDSWKKAVPLLEGENLTTVCITSSSSATANDSIIVTGSNYGYVRVFNHYGVCINLTVTPPVVAAVSSVLSSVFLIFKTGERYSYSIVDVDDDFRFLQQDCALPLRGPNPIKGLFFNEFCDPCIVTKEGNVLVLSHWRETGNARWVPLLNTTDAVTDFGTSEAKRAWTCWPLGLADDKLACLVLKNADAYPGFPLPLPVELDIRVPVVSYGRFNALKAAGDDAGLAEKVAEEDPEEVFLRVSSLGKLVQAALKDIDEKDEAMERINNYSVLFDKSLLRMFAQACQHSRVNEALSIVRLVKNDKALLAAAKIAERFEMDTLAGKVGQLRQELHDGK